MEQMPENDLNSNIDALREYATRLQGLAAEVGEKSAELSKEDWLELSSAFNLLQRSIGEAAITADALADASNTVLRSA